VSVIVCVRYRVLSGIAAELIPVKTGMKSGKNLRAGSARAVVLRLRNAIVAGLCGMAAQSVLMGGRHWLGILPAFQPYDDLQRLLAEAVGAAWAPTLSWLLPMASGAVVWSSIFAWAYDVIPARTATGKGLVVTILAWLMTGLVILPALGHGVFAVGAGAGGWPALMMLGMLAAYCLTLSLVYGRLKRGEAGP
jgi:hypothetical protein